MYILKVWLLGWTNYERAWKVSERTVGLGKWAGIGGHSWLALLELSKAFWKIGGPLWRRCWLWRAMLPSEKTGRKKISIPMGSILEKERML